MQLTQTTGTPWTPEQVSEAFAQAGITASQHFLMYGYDEGLAPNGYFNADQYATSKAAAAGITVDEFKAAWKAASGSDNLYLHYVDYGAFEEGVSPSDGFDDAKYYQSKADQLTATTGTTWTAAQVEASIKEAGLNAISHYQLYGKDESLSYTPTSQGITGETFTLTTGIDVIAGTPYNDTINGVASALSAAKTLNAGDQIDGGEGTDTLNVTVSSSFSGFSGDGYMKNVENVNLTSDSTIARDYDATGSTGVTAYTIDATSAAINLKNVADLKSTVTLKNQAKGTFSLGYATNVTKGTSDTQALAFNNVGTVNDPTTTANEEQAVTTSITGVEALTLAVTGANVAAFTADATTSLTVTGDGSLKLTTAPKGLKTLDASAATGALNIDLTKATTSKVSSATLGSGDDTLTVDDASAAMTATLAGGAGNDTLVMKNTAATSTVQYNQSGFETIKLANTGALTVSAVNTTDLTKIQASSTMTADVTFASLGSNDYTVELAGKNATTKTVTLDNTGATTVLVDTPEAAATSTSPTGNDLGVTALKTASLDMTVAEKMKYTGTVNVAKASSVNLNINGEMATGATINAAAATSVVIGSVAQDSVLALTTAAATDLNVTAAKKLDLTGSTLSGLESLTANTNGLLDISGVALAKIAGVTLEGTGSVELGALGAATQSDYGITLTATGLSSDEATGTTSLKVGTIDTKGQDISVNASGVLGAVTLGDISADNSATTAGNVDVNLDGVGGAFSLGAITGKNVTLNAAGALGTTGYGALSVGDTLTFTGANLTTNDLTVGSVNATGTSFTGTLTGGLLDDKIAITDTGNATTSFVISGDLGTATTTNTVSIDANGNTAATKIDASGMTNAALTLTGGSGADTITGAAGDDTITGGLGADKITVGSGTDTLVYTALSGTNDTGAALTDDGSVTSYDIISGVAAGDMIKTNGTVAAVTNTLDGSYTGAVVAGTAAITLIRGDYNSSTGAFASSATGSDSILEWADGTADNGTAGIVLVGYAGSSTTSAADGIVTLA